MDLEQLRVGPHWQENDAAENVGSLAVDSESDRDLACTNGPESERHGTPSAAAPANGGLCMTASDAYVANVA